jgi:hypothetical protein
MAQRSVATGAARTIGSMAADGARTWILTGSPETHAATATHVIACTERWRNQAPLSERLPAAAGDVA